MATGVIDIMNFLMRQTKGATLFSVFIEDPAVCSSITTKPKARIFRMHSREKSIVKAVLRCFSAAS